jgi:hypothetical protein
MVGIVMTTAREQAREAASGLWPTAARSEAVYFAMSGADAASDVWEPIVRRLFAELSLAQRYVTDVDGQVEISEALHLAKEALG